jgi:hypothetical protein
MSDAHTTGTNLAVDGKPMRLRDALRQARIEAADRTGVVVDLRDAEVARLEILNVTPRLWIDIVAHVLMGRDKRIYRFVQDTRFGRIVLAESHDVAKMVDAITDYIARRMIEREHALVATPAPVAAGRPRRGGFWTFAFGFIVGVAALFGFALFAALRSF